MERGAEGSNYPPGGVRASRDGQSQRGERSTLVMRCAFSFSLHLCVFINFFSVRAGSLVATDVLQLLAHCNAR